MANITPASVGDVFRKLCILDRLLAFYYFYNDVLNNKEVARFVDY